MSTLLKIIALLLLLLASLLTSCKKDDLSPQEIKTEDDLNNYLQKIIKVNNINGLAVTIIENDELAFQKSFGCANQESKIPFTNQTQIGVASVSKVFIGAAVAKSIEQGLFTMDTPINDLLPFPVNNPKKPGNLIRVRHLVSHTSGIVDLPEDYIRRNYFFLPNQNLSGEGAQMLIAALQIKEEQQISLGEYIASYFQSGGEYFSPKNFMDSAPGETWSYSNVGASLMGYIIEVSSGRPFYQYVAEEVLQPLQMNRSSLNLSAIDFTQVATPYYQLSKPFPFYGNHACPEGGLYSTNEDLGFFLMDMLKGIKGQSSVLFSESYYELMFTKQLATSVIPYGFADNHGLFWYKKGGAWMHGGNSFGVSAHLELEEDGDSGFVITTNSDGTFVENQKSWEFTKMMVSAGIKEFIKNHN